MQLTLYRRSIIKNLSLIALALITIHIIILVIYFYINDPHTFSFVHMFDLDMERNIPTFFSSILLLISGFLFYLLYKTAEQTSKKTSNYWLGLSVVFTFLAIDENAKIHEQVGDFTKHFIDTGGYLYYPWVISYVSLTLILAIIYLRFFLSMPRMLFWSFMFSATLFLTGAVGFEMLGAKESSLHGTCTITYSIFYTIEESLEMFGVIYLIDILLGLLQSKYSLRIN